MKCQKCGSTLPQGYLYCPGCGNEYQIVPDFEPELENKIAKTMSDVGESIFAGEKEGILPEKNEIEKAGKRDWVYYSLLSTFFLITVIVFLFFQYNHSAFYFRTMAEKAVEQEEYTQAIEFYDKLRKKEPQQSLWYLKEADLELRYGDRDIALQLCYRAIEEADKTEEIYAFLFRLLLEDKAYRQIYELLQECPFDTLVKEYEDYNSLVGTLSHDGGNYDQIIKLSLENFSDRVYYTTDGSTPDENSFLYTGPIILGKGVHTISFLPCNEFGILGNVVRKEYIVNTQTPVPPKVLPESGSFEQPEKIEISVEEDTTVYYSIDGSDPTKEDLEYTHPIPIPQGRSTFRFIAISKTGKNSEVTKRNYEVNIEASISVQEAEQRLMEELINNGHILDRNGAILNRYGVFRYFYTFPLKIGGRNYYIFEEHYLENLIDNPLGNFYGVDMETGISYVVKKDFFGNYDIVKN